MSPDQAPPAGVLPCPRCSGPLVAGAPSCPHCALPLTGPVAGELWAVDQQIGVLRGRRTVLLERLAAPRPAVDRGRPPAVAGGHPHLPPPFPAPPAAPRPVPGPRRRLGAQQLLLGAGVLLVAVAAVVFAAVVWSAVGVLGQAAVLLTVCAASAAAARLAARRGLGSSAEALAVLAVVVLVVDVVAARSLGLLGLGTTDADAYALGGLLVVVGAAAAADRLLRVVPRAAADAGPPVEAPVGSPAGSPAGPPVAAPRGSRPVAFAWAAVLGTAGVPAVLVRAVDGGALTWAAAALALALAAATASPLVGRRGRGLAPTALAVSGAHLASGVLALLGVVLARDSRLRLLEAAAEFALLALASALVVLRTRRARPLLARTARVTSWTGAGGVLLSLSLLGGSSALLALAGVLAAAAAGALVLRRPVPWGALAVVQAVALAALLVEPVAGAVQGGGPAWGRPLAWGLLAVSAGLTGQRRPAPSGTGEEAAASWTALSAAAALVAAGTVPGGAPRDLRTWSVLVLATALLALAARAARRGAPAREAVLVAGWVLGVGTALALTAGPQGPGATDPWAVLAVAGASALALAVLPGRVLWSVLGVVLLSAAWWSFLGGTTARTPEVWTVPPALLALAVGAAVWVRAPTATSWQVLGPGLVVGLAPSVVLSWGEDDLLRPAVTVLAAAVVCTAGVLRSWQAPLVVGAAGAALVAVGQLGPYAVGAPLWASLGAAGAVLLVLAVRIEQARRDAARTLAWVRALT